MPSVGQVLLAASYTTSALRTMYSVPALTTDLLEFASFDWEGSGSAHIAFGTVRGGVYRAIGVHDFSAAGAYNWNGRCYVESGDGLFLYQPTAGLMNVWLSGRRIT